MEKEVGAKKTIRKEATIITAMIANLKCDEENTSNSSTPRAMLVVNPLITPFLFSCEAPCSRSCRGRISQNTSQSQDVLLDIQKYRKSRNGDHPHLYRMLYL